VKILCKLSTETKRYSSHNILQNFNSPTKQRPLLSTAILWRRHSNVLLPSAPLVQRPNAVTARRHARDDTQHSRPCCRGQPMMVTQRRHHSSNTTHSRGN